jgi:hypothetical protein
MLNTESPRWQEALEALSNISLNAAKKLNLELPWPWLPYNAGGVFSGVAADVPLAVAIWRSSYARSHSSRAKFANGHTRREKSTEYFGYQYCCFILMSSDAKTSWNCSTGNMYRGSDCELQNANNHEDHCDFSKRSSFSVSH